MSGITRSASGRRVWLLEIDLGHVYRFSTEAVDVSTFGGSRYRYDEGLVEPGVALDVAAGRDEVSISVDVLCGVDWAEIVSRGVPIAGRKAMVLRHESGSLYERARVVLRGQIVSVSHGAVGETLSVTIRRAPAENADTLPPPQAVIDGTTWPTTTPNFYVPDDSVGAMYPLVIGSPGYNGGGNAYPAMQVYYAQYFGAGAASSFVPVGDGTIAASQVRMYVVDEPNPTPLLTTPFDTPVTQRTDLLGRTLSVTRPESSSGNGWRDVRLYVGFGGTAGGGVKDRRGSPIRGAGSVLRWAFAEHMSLDVDWARFESVADRLDAYKIDTFLVTPTNIWEWLQEEILPILPLELRESTAGIYPFLWRWNSTARDSVMRLDATLSTGNVARTSGMGAAAGEIYNEITIEYGPYSDADAYRFRKIATAAARATVRAASPTDDARIRGSALLGDSQRIYGLRPLTLQMGCVWDHATAELVLRDRINAHAWPRRQVSYAGTDRLETLQAGDVVTVTDPELHLTDVVALVWEVVPEGESVNVTLTLLDHPRLVRRQTT